MSDPLAFRAWHDGRAAGRAEVAVVLLDLIADLRAMPAACDVCCDAPGELAADRAEARLREVTGDE